MKSFAFFLSCLLLFSLISCEKEAIELPRELPTDCGTPITIDRDFSPPNMAHGEAYTDVSIDGLCLTLTVGSSGCDTAGWTMELITRGDIAESMPTQTNAYALFSNGVPPDQFTCQAYFTREFSFDLGPYLSEGGLPTLLTLEPLDTTILIE